MPGMHGAFYVLGMLYKISYLLYYYHKNTAHAVNIRGDRAWTESFWSVTVSQSKNYAVLLTVRKNGRCI